MMVIIVMWWCNAVFLEVEGRGPGAWQCRKPKKGECMKFVNLSPCTGWAHEFKRKHFSILDTHNIIYSSVWDHTCMHASVTHLHDVQYWVLIRNCRSLVLLYWGWRWEGGERARNSGGNTLWFFTHTCINLDHVYASPWYNRHGWLGVKNHLSLYPVYAHIYMGDTFTWCAVLYPD